MKHTFNDSIEYTLISPEKYNNKQISEYWFHEVISKFFPLGNFTVLPSLINLLNQAEIIILGFHTFDGEGNEIPVDMFLPSSIEITFAPGHLKKIPDNNPILDTTQKKGPS